MKRNRKEKKNVPRHAVSLSKNHFQFSTITAQRKETVKSYRSLLDKWKKSTSVSFDHYLDSYRVNRGACVSHLAWRGRVSLEKYSENYCDGEWSIHDRLWCFQTSVVERKMRRWFHLLCRCFLFMIDRSCAVREALKNRSERTCMPIMA